MSFPEYQRHSLLRNTLAADVEYGAGLARIESETNGSRTRAVPTAGRLEASSWRLLGFNYEEGGRERPSREGVSDLPGVWAEGADRPEHSPSKARLAPDDRTTAAVQDVAPARECTVCDASYGLC